MYVPITLECYVHIIMYKAKKAFPLKKIVLLKAIYPYPAGVTMGISLNTLQICM